MSLVWLAFGALPALALALTLWNVFSLRRGHVEGRAQARVSVLIPARNEESRIAACVRSVVHSGGPVHEIIVCDDESRDGTRRVLAELAKETPLLRVLAGKPKPDGWVGKPHACHQLGAAASGEILVFIDADTQLAQGGLARLLSFLGGAEATRADLVSAVPAQQMGSFGERLLLPLLHLTYTSWLPLNLVLRSKDPRCVAANGQLLAIRRDAYRAIGGFASVAHEIVDDVALCRRAKALGLRVAFADGARMATCRMYHSLSEVFRGFSKNIYEGVGESPWALAVVLALYLGTFVVPYVGVGVALAHPPLKNVLLGPALFGVSANVALRAALALRFRHPLSGLLLHPLSVLLFCGIALNSYRWSKAGKLAWAGRSYPARRLRALEAER